MHMQSPVHHNLVRFMVCIDVTREVFLGPLKSISAGLDPSELHVKSSYD